MEEDAFIDAILAAPDDDAPRLVYADWLSERGDPRGEFIVVQCTRARLEREDRLWTPEHQVARLRQDRLLGEHEKSWLAPSCLTRDWGNFHRGFITNLAVSIAELRERGSMFERLPLEKITIKMRPQGGTVGDIAWVARTMQRVPRIGIFPPEGEAVLDAAILRADIPDVAGPEHAEPAWPKEGAPHPLLRRALRSLHFANPRPPMLAELGAVGDLETLSFFSTEGLSPDAITAFLATPLVRNITELSAGFLEPDAATAFFRAKNLPVLRTFKATRGMNAALAPDAAVFAASELLPQLESFETDLKVDAAVVATLEGRMPSLTKLTLNYAPAPGALEAFLATGCAHRLRYLAVKANEPGAAGLFARAALADLRALWLFEVKVTDDDAAALVKAPGLASVARFDGFGDFGRNARDILRTRWPDAWLTG